MAKLSVIKLPVDSLAYGWVPPSHVRVLHVYEHAPYVLVEERPVQRLSTRKRVKRGI